MPHSVWMCGKPLHLSAPREIGAGCDFINLALDDEYGLRNLPFRPRTILDVGTNFGLFSILAAHYCEEANIHAYEPNPRVFPYADRNLSLIGATAFPAAIGCRSGFAEIRDEGDSRLAQTILAEDGSIRVIALREAIDRLGGTADLLKLDCEGAEWDIFKDSESFKKVRLIRMEYHLTDGHRLEDVKVWAQKLGFHIDRLSPNQGFGVAWLSQIRG